MGGVDYVGFGCRLLALIDRHGMTQRELAEMIPVTQPQVSSWVNGKRFPYAENLLRLSEIFNVSVDYLLKGGDRK